MYRQRFGRKLKLPSTVAIKHGLLKLMLEDHLNAQAWRRWRLKPSIPRSARCRR